MFWKDYLKHERDRNFLMKIYVFMRKGGSVEVFNVESPIAKVTTGIFIEGKYLLSLREALKRKEKKNEEFAKKLKDFHKKMDEIEKQKKLKSLEKLMVRLSSKLDLMPSSDI